MSRVLQGNSNFMSKVEAEDKMMDWCLFSTKLVSRGKIQNTLK